MIISDSLHAPRSSSGKIKLVWMGYLSLDEVWVKSLPSYKEYSLQIRQTSTKHNIWVIYKALIPGYIAHQRNLV